ncbi:hypothetical protein FQZ97_495190 [compost metagenome]
MSPFTSDIPLAEALQQLAIARGEARCWLLIDPLLRKPAEDDEWQGLAGELAARETPVRLEHRNIEPKAWPRLIALDLARPRDADINRAAAGMAIRDWSPESLRQGLGRRIGGWLFGAPDTGALARHLGRIMLQVRPGGGRALLRLHDPAVLDQAWRLASAAQRTALLGPADAWVNLDRWVRLASYGDARARAGTRESGAPLQFDAEQWGRIDAAGAVNRAWRVVADQAPAITAGMLTQAVDCVRRGAALGLLDPRDWEAMAIRALTVHPEFDRHPRLAALLEAREPDVGFARLVMDLTDADWAAIARDCRPPRPAHQQVREEE